MSGPAGGSRGISRGIQVVGAGPLARALGLSVTAEGVETTDQLDRLRELGCQQGQGFLFSRPVAVADLPALLTATTLPFPSGLAAA